jgi:hypothetical protein
MLVRDKRTSLLCVFDIDEGKKSFVTFTSRPNAIKLFLPLLMEVRNKLEYLSLAASEMPSPRVSSSIAHEN